MDLKARLEGIRPGANNILKWNLVFTPMTKPGTIASSNRWVVSVNQVSGEIVFDRNGLYIRSNLATAATDALSMNENEKMVATIFHILLQRYPDNKDIVSISMEFEISDEKICHYILNPILTADIKSFKLPTRL